jgi:hypothetical protein
MGSPRHSQGKTPYFVERKFQKLFQIFKSQLKIRLNSGISVRLYAIDR